MKIYCDVCKQKTNHELLTSGSRKEYDENDSSIWEEYKWLVYECQGCNHITFCKENYYSEDYEYDPEYDELEIKPYNVRFFPGKPADEILVQQTYLKIPFGVNSIYGEIIRAYNSNSFILVAIGLRTLLEAILNEKNSYGKNLMEQIENAEFIPLNIRQNLHALRFIGNAATHQLDIPDKYDLLQAIEIIQDILNITYSLDYKSTLLFTKVKNNHKKV